MKSFTGFAFESVDCNLIFTYIMETEHYSLIGISIAALKISIRSIQT